MTVARETESPNESFNSVIWHSLLKTVFAGLETLKLGVMCARICCKSIAKASRLFLKTRHRSRKVWSSTNLEQKANKWNQIKRKEWKGNW